MRDEILNKLYNNSVYLEYLRYHPKWYYYLEDNPNNYLIFERKVKEDLKITTYDKLEKMKKQISFASKFIDYFKNK
jgi:hypothetical protein